MTSFIGNHDVQDDKLALYSQRHIGTSCADTEVQRSGISPVIPFKMRSSAATQESRMGGDRKVLTGVDRVTAHRRCDPITMDMVALAIQK